MENSRNYYAVMLAERDKLNESQIRLLSEDNDKKTREINQLKDSLERMPKDRCSGLTAAFKLCGRSGANGSTRIWSRSCMTSPTGFGAPWKTI